MGGWAQYDRNGLILFQRVLWGGFYVETQKGSSPVGSSYLRRSCSILGDDVRYIFECVSLPLWAHVQEALRLFGLCTLGTSKGTFPASGRALLWASLWCVSSRKKGDVYVGFSSMIQAESGDFLSVVKFCSDLGSLKLWFEIMVRDGWRATLTVLCRWWTWCRTPTVAYLVPGFSSNLISASISGCWLFFVNFVNLGN